MPPRTTAGRLLGPGRRLLERCGARRLLPTLFAEEVAGSNDVAVARFVDAVAEKVAGPFACRHADRHRAVEPIANGDTPRRFVDVFDGAVRARSQRPRARGRIRRVVAPAAGDLALRLL